MGSDAKKPIRRRLPPWLVATASSLIGVIVFLGGVYGFYAVAYADSVLPNVTVGSIPVGGLAAAELEAELRSETAPFLATPFELTIDQEAISFDPASVSLAYDLAATSERALAYGHTGQLGTDIPAQVGALLTVSQVAPVYTYDSEALEQFIADLATKYETPEEPVTVSYERTITLHEPRAGQQFDHDRLRSALVAAFETVSQPSHLVFPLAAKVPAVTLAEVRALLPEIERILASPLSLTHEQGKFTVDEEQLAAWIRFTSATSSATSTLDGFYQRGSAASLAFDEPAMEAYVKTLAEDLNQPAVDAKLSIKDGRATVFQQSQDGLSLQEAEAMTAIVKVLEKRRLGSVGSTEAVKLPLTKTKATVTSSTVDQLGIKELIGTATTDFSGSPSNRIHNITTGTKYLKGWLVKPGEEFSTVKAIGAVDSSTGYLPELVIKENRTIPEYGGGLCQVSTTLFRAVLNAGLPVTERRQHSYRVSYYEREIGPGLDATIYLPKPDFKFKNDTPGWLLVQGAVNGLTVTFELYGTSDGRESSIDGPHTLSTTPAPETVYEETDQLAPGEEKQVEKPHAGATTVATYTVRRGGEVINEQSFQSKYKALPARILRGKAVAAEPAPEQSTPSTEVTESAPSQAEEPVETTNQ